MVGEILKEFPFYGSRRIAHEIEKRYGETISYGTVVQIMKDITPKKEPVVAERIEISEPDAIWHMDMTPKRIAKGKIQYIFGVIDACTRRVLAVRNYDGCTSAEVIDCLYVAIINNGGKKPRMLYTDNGGQFVSKIFEDCLKAQSSSTTRWTRAARGRMGRSRDYSRPCSMNGLHTAGTTLRSPLRNHWKSSGSGSTTRGRSRNSDTRRQCRL